MHNELALKTRQKLQNQLIRIEGAEVIQLRQKLLLSMVISLSLEIKAYQMTQNARNKMMKNG